MVDMRRREESVSEELMTEVASAYYLEECSKTEIAHSTGLSRWQVARVLTEARDRGLVTIRVAVPEPPLGTAGVLAESLGVRRVIIAGRSAISPGEGSRWRSTHAVAAALAAYLSESVQPGESLGLGWSRVIECLPAELDRLAPCDVVQIAGALTFAGDRIGSVEVVRLVARIAEGTAHPIYAPLVAPSSEIATALMRTEEISRALGRAERVDHAVVGIGTWTSEGSSILPLLPVDLVRRTTAAGACAVISGRVLDQSGAALDAGSDGRIVGMTLQQLRQVPYVVGTCVGAHRVEAVRAAVRSGLIDTLVVDEPLAVALLDS
ncbi:sugar-binding transcriptional regulator [Brachybacterium kimchii]|uniref:Sugar-binding domain-containing protein n=1 Tax=Brachybacterium kimchii TaxID=2942909 RepID=A0ABY4N1W3_9MICO|nr:sugar-binding domain-containing protein [Brachybacterium kimchii]UQN28536.1 hypothetical protein M4486_12940 [Brachybacterium kimchii]